MGSRLSPAEEGRLREALLDLCQERGYENLRLADLLAQADLGDEEFSRSYADLEDYFCAVIAEICDDFYCRAEGVLAGCSDSSQRLNAIGGLAMKFLGEDPRVAHLVVVDTQNAGERARLVYEQASGGLFDLIDDGRSEREGDGTMGRATVNAIGGAIYTQIYLALARGENFRTDFLPRLKGMSCPTWDRPAAPNVDRPSVVSSHRPA